MGLGYVSSGGAVGPLQPRNTKMPLNNIVTIRIPLWKSIISIGVQLLTMLLKRVSAFTDILCFKKELIAVFKIPRWTILVSAVVGRSRYVKS